MVTAINSEAPGGPLQGLVSLTAIFQKLYLYVIDDNNQIADQLQLHELPPEDLYGLSTSTYKKQTAQKLICNNLRKSTLKRLLERLKEESDQAGPGSVEQISRPSGPIF